MRVTLHSSRVIFCLINRKKTCQNRRQSWMARINIPSRSLSDPGFRGDFHSWGENENVKCAIDLFCQTLIFEVHLRCLLIFQFRIIRFKRNAKPRKKWKLTFDSAGQLLCLQFASESVFSCWQITSKLIIPKICHKSFEPSATPWLLEGSWTNWRRIKETWRSLWSRMDQHIYALLQTRKR